MTLLLLCGATDGILAVADGRTTRTETDGTSYPLSDRAQKCATVDGAAIVALAAGRVNFTQKSVADIFAEALATAAAAATAADEQLTVRDAAHVCFDALMVENERHNIAGCGVFGLVAGFDDSHDGAQVFEFTVPDTQGGVVRSADVERDQFVAEPVYNKTSQLARSLFGLLSVDEYLDRLDTPGADLHGSYTYRACALTEVEAAVSRILPAFIADGSTQLDEEGIGGFWTVFRIRPGEGAERTRQPWGPMRATDGD